MSKLVCAARTSVACLGGVAIIAGSFITRDWLENTRRGEASRELLYGSQSPFQDPGFLSLAGSDPVPRTDIAVRTPLTPFGAGEDFSDGTIERIVLRGETFSSIWASLGGASEGGTSAAKALVAAKVELRALRAGERLVVTKKGGEITEIRRAMGDGATLVLTGDTSEGYIPRMEQARVIQKEKRLTGIVMSSLVDSASGMSIPYSVVDDFVDLFSNRVEFRRDLQPGDTFSVVFDERRTEDGELLAPGSIKAASLKLGDKLLAVVLDVTADGTVRYFDEKGEMPGKFFLRYPVQYTRISSVFTTARFHPVLNVSRPHNGVDFAAPTGTPVRTIGEGTVVFSGFSKSTGNVVKIAHDSRYVTEYMHLSKISTGVTKGSRVSRGQVIGAVGQTGLATGPHLHFGLFDSGHYVDPLKAKIMQVPQEVKPPQSVLAMLESLKKNHELIAVASAASDKRA